MLQCLDAIDRNSLSIGISRSTAACPGSIVVGCWLHLSLGAKQSISDSVASALLPS